MDLIVISHMDVTISVHFFVCPQKVGTIWMAKGHPKGEGKKPEPKTNQQES